ncbi:hypothetical protein CEXT_556271 [Caerostris extrusa]|uniref:Uncharacterized protein n=1 Tax=Caerostris extrusa TaxID=172846 RepID=A0AAV4X0M4_CAEEX|nr:hypothetical protein CEXT_556271 [Caerostris extrusa]
MCEHDKLHIPDLRLDIYCLLCYIDVHHHHLPSQSVRQNNMDWAHTPALDRRLLVDRPYEILFFTRGL